VTYCRAICLRCKVNCEQRRLMVLDPSGAELPAVQCLECEAVCLATAVAAPAEQVAPKVEPEP